MLLLLGCAPSFVGPAGPETLRAALIFEEDGHPWVLLANSYLPCDGETEDDPRTVEDEEAIAIAYRSAQVATALTREGALVVALGLPGDGSWEVGKEATGAWYYVEEAMRYGQDGMIATYLPTVVQQQMEVARGSADLEEGEGSFAFEESGVSGSFSATICEDVVLRQQLWSKLTELSTVIVN